MLTWVSNKSDLTLDELNKTGVALSNEIANVNNEIVNVKTYLSNEIANLKTDTDLIKIDVTAFKNDLFN